MDSPWLILVLFSWALRFTFLLMFLPSYILERASYISFGVFLDETWGIKWSLMESATILYALIISFLCFSLASTSSGLDTYSLTYLSRSFSCRMRPILYFHAWKFSMPSSLSSSLVLGAILSKNHKKLKFCGMRNWPYQEMHLNEVSWLMCLDSGDLNSSPSKSDLQDSASAVFWFSSFLG